ncbi:hypothetical protein PRZ48_012798 [Zasmidium cellare]|uniref:Uncharacterized protein n=1 Tax=Zasmidium cellare TaxID=395010 RepID=A0ABR0E669_ZASCE|nr:hypothetical protein PRZ48_012798 [Zasmidium cellare]
MAQRQLAFFPSYSPSTMSDQTTAIGAMGAVLGYIGAEGATTAPFERLFWPQRAYANFNWRHTAKFAVLGATGGPIYKAALQVMDGVCANRLLRGSRLGNMLGSSFYPQSPSTYTVHGDSSGLNSPTKQARNCLWQRVVTQLPPPDASFHRKQDAEDGDRPSPAVRACASVHHITLSVCSISKTAAGSIRTESPKLSFRIVEGIIVSEAINIVCAVLVALLWKSWIAVLWTLPLLIKLVSAATALDRDELSIKPHMVQGEGNLEQAQNFEVHLQSEIGTFLVLTGPPKLVFQFFRHYGHPKRSHSRELTQFVLVIALAALFPIGLVLSVTIMPEGIQYFWISSQMYLVLAMYVSRYTSIGLWASMEEWIAEVLVRNGDGGFVFVDGQSGLGVKARLESTHHRHYGEAKAAAESLLQTSAMKHQPQEKAPSGPPAPSS